MCKSEAWGDGEEGRGGENVRTDRMDRVYVLRSQQRHNSRNSRPTHSHPRTFTSFFGNHHVRQQNPRSGKVVVGLD
jgi:hypothetical protein